MQGLVPCQASVPQDFILGNFQPSLRDCLVSYTFPRTGVLGYFQPSLRD